MLHFGLMDIGFLYFRSYVKCEKGRKKKKALGGITKIQICNLWMMSANASLSPVRRSPMNFKRFIFIIYNLSTKHFCTKKKNKNILL